jgi:hypothetical protein
MGEIERLQRVLINTRIELETAIGYAGLPLTAAEALNRMTLRRCIKCKTWRGNLNENWLCPTCRGQS